MTKAEQHTDTDTVVSFDTDLLILVDENDQEIGSRDKAACHLGQGTLHRAFSLFIFNSEGELLLQQRSSQKRLWPLYWSNSCCSHPRHGEDMEQSVQRRLKEELGFECDLHYLYKFQYQAQFDEQGAEHELCSVFVGRSDGPVSANRNEIEAWRYIKPAVLQQELKQHPEQFTPWFKLEWQRLNQDFKEQLQHYCGVVDEQE